MRHLRHVFRIVVFLSLAVASAGHGQARDNLPPTTHAALLAPPPAALGKGSSARPDSALPLTIDTAHFRLHYSDSGPDRPLGWPGTTYLDSLSSSLEQVYRCLHDTLGLPTPLPDGELGGGTDLIDCYLRKFEPGFIGSMAIDTCGGEGPCGDRCVGHTFVDTDLTARWRRSMAALAYAQLMLWATNPGADYWFEISIGVWAERAVFGLSSKYTYWLFSWFTSPYLPLDASKGRTRLDGSVHYWAMLEEKLGRSFVPELWMRCCGRDWQPILDQMLREHGTSFDESLLQLALWCNATGEAADTLHFRDAREYPPVSCQARHREYPVQDASIPSDSLARATGSNFIRFLGPGTHEGLRIRFQGNPGVREQRRVSLVITRARNHHEEITVIPDELGDAEFAVPAWNACDYATLIVTNLSGARGDLGYVYSAEELGAPAPGRISELLCSPDPFSAHTRITFTATGVRMPASLEIYDVHGRRVRTIEIDSSGQGKKKAFWFGGDDQGEVVPAGCYFVRARYGPAEETRRVVYLR